MVVLMDRLVSPGRLVDPRPGTSKDSRRKAILRGRKSVSENAKAFGPNRFGRPAQRDNRARFGRDRPPGLVLSISMHRPGNRARHEAEHPLDAHWRSPREHPNGTGSARLTYEANGRCAEGREAFGAHDQAGRWRRTWWPEFGRDSNACMDTVGARRDTANERSAKSLRITRADKE